MGAVFEPQEQLSSGVIERGEAEFVEDDQCDPWQGFDDPDWSQRSGRACLCAFLRLVPTIVCSRPLTPVPRAQGVFDVQNIISIPQAALAC